MRHYFVNTEKKPSDFFEFSEEFLGHKFYFNSSNDIFSKNEIDFGTQTLVQTIVKTYENISGKVLDVGCGYGAIPIVLSKFYSGLKFTMVDVNKTAVMLSKQNIEKNNITNNEFEVLESNLFENVTDTKFDYIFTNPPIKTGKKLLHEIIDQGHEKLNSNGHMVLVIRKDHGSDSLKKHMQEVFGNSEVLKRNKGHYVLRSIKM